MKRFMVVLNDEDVLSCDIESAILSWGGYGYLTTVKAIEMPEPPPLPEPEWRIRTYSHLLGWLLAPRAFATEQEAWDELRACGVHWADLGGRVQVVRVR